MNSKLFSSLPFASYLALAVSTFTVSTLISSNVLADSNLKPIKTLSGLRLVLVEGTVELNCKTSTPEDCKSRKDINISRETTAYLKKTIAQMIPGQERFARQQSEAQSIREENERLKGTGQELQIAKNLERLTAVTSEVHSDYFNMHFVNYLWSDDTMPFGRLRYSNWSTDNDDALESGRDLMMDDAQNKELASDYHWSLRNGGDTYRFNRQIRYSYNPLMEMSFIIKFNSFVFYPMHAGQLYASEEVVARCEERRIYSTIWDVKTRLAERNILCKLPENMGSLRFKILE